MNFFAVPDVYSVVEEDVCHTVAVMNKMSEVTVMDEALEAYDASNFLHAENLSRRFLQQGCNDTHCCPEFTTALFLAAKSHAQLMHDDQILNDLVAVEPQQATCILFHEFPVDLGRFHGTEDDFNAMRQRTISTTLSPGRISIDNLNITLFMCGLCLDYGLYKSALNLALQLHLSAWISEQSDATSVNCLPNIESGNISDWSEFGQVHIEGDYLTLDLPPAGLTRDLWMRITECCRGLSPYLEPPESDWNWNKSDTHKQHQKVNGDPEYSIRSIAVNKVDRQPPNSNEKRCFSRVHEFSVKEEQLRSHAHAIHDCELQSPPSADSHSECVDIPDWLRGSDLGEVASQRANEDYLPGMWTESAAAPFTWRPVRLEDGAVPMAGCNTNNACFTEVRSSSTCSTLSSASEINKRQPRSRLPFGISGDHGNYPSMNGEHSNAPTDDQGAEYDHRDSEEFGSKEIDAGSVTENLGDRFQDTTDDTSLERNRSSTPPPGQLIRRVSILRTSHMNLDGEPTKTPSKRVRFSLDSAHPSPDLEAEYGGRSNRRRLLDFARRRQLLSHMATDLAYDSDDPYSFLLHINFSPFFWLARSSQILRWLLRSVVFIRLNLLVLLCIFIPLVTSFAVLFCSSTLHMSWEQLFWDSHTQFDLAVNNTSQLDPTTNSSLSAVASQQICRSIFRWLRGCFLSRRLIWFG